MHEEHCYNDPHLEDREFFVPIDHPEIGVHMYPTTAFKMTDTKFEVRKPPVRLGEDNDYIYQEVIGLSDEEYGKLKSLGQIGMDYDAHIR